MDSGSVPGRRWQRQGAGPTASRQGGDRQAAPWLDLSELLQPVKARWALAVLINADGAGGATSRLKDLLKAINEEQQNAGARLLARPVLTATVKRLEEQGLVVRDEVSKVPAITLVRLTPWGREVTAQLEALRAWYNARRRQASPGHPVPWHPAAGRRPHPPGEHPGFPRGSA